VILFPNCKINLGLYVTGKLPNGYHTIETCFYPIPIQDVLEIIAPPEARLTTLSISGIPIEHAANNSCLKAYELLKKDFPLLPPVQIHLHKAIPAGGGLGGGSSDAAFTLLLLNKKFNLSLDAEKLIHYASQLGSDCAFFIRNTPCLASGRGEILQPFPLDLAEYKMVLVNPGIHINTGWAYTQIKIEAPKKSLAEILNLPLKEWKQHLFNVFETPIFQTHPSIQKIKETLYQNGAVYAAMSGSGATVYGLFKKSDVIQLPFPPHYLLKEC
jgi:4-diphosphocytidyl-2-C-methyl-D-erythritol kinase